MQKIILTIAALLTFNLIGLAAIPVSDFVVTPKTETPKINKLSAKDNARIAQMKFYTNLSLKDYEKLKGKKLNFIERQLFKTSQHRMRKMLKNYNDGDGPTILQKMSWFLKGLLLGPIAVLLAYIFLKDEERDLIKWAWFGFIGFAALVLVVVITLL